MRWLDNESGSFGDGVGSGGFEDEMALKRGSMATLENR